MQDLDLPPSDTVRWSPRRKASVVRGVRSGAISFDEACRRYQLSAEEFQAWQEAIEAHGIGSVARHPVPVLPPGCCQASRASPMSPMSAAPTRPC
jgi:transposase-like protein